MIQELENLGGYQAVQLQRYWLFVRTLQRQPMRYNYAIFVYPPPVVSDLLGVGWVIAGSRDSPGTGYDPVADDGRWTLYRRSRLPPRASFLTTWAVVRNSEAALEAVAGPGYEPSKTAVLEEEPGISQTPSAPPPASITYRTLGNQAARVDVEASTAGIVLVRNVWDRNWHATIDGREGRVIPTDYLVQGVPVGPGRHTILFRYDDPTVGYGMLGSVIVLVTLAGAAVVAWRRERRVRRGAVRELTASSRPD
jgi:hypothetical protein